MKKRKIVVIEEDGTEKTIGYTDGIRAFLPRDRVEGFYRKHNGWAVDERVIILYPDIQLFVVQTTDEDDNPINYIATRDDMIDHRIEIEHHQHGSQYCLPWKYWTPYR